MCTIGATILCDTARNLSHLTIKYNHSLIRYCRSYDEEEEETTITTYVQKRALSRKLIKHDHNLRYCRSYEYEEGETFISDIIIIIHTHTIHDSFESELLCTL